MTTSTLKGIVIAHDDHDLQPAHLAFIDQVLATWGGEFIIRHVTLPDNCPDLLSALYGPEAGDKPVTDDMVITETRGNRKGPSRMIDAPMRPCRNMVMIGMQVEDGTKLLFTAYGTQANGVSPKEPTDQSLTDDERPRSVAFWATHALATGV